jgi:hypothetical protein
MCTKAFLLLRRLPTSHSGIAALATLGGPMLAVLACMSAHAAEPRPTGIEKQAAAPVKPLDVRAPDITHLVSAEELARLVEGTVAAELEEVKVEGPSELPPDRPPVWPGLLAPFWALAHPTQAWRIFTPLPADKVSSKSP